MSDENAGVVSTEGGAGGEAKRASVICLAYAGVSYFVFLGTLSAFILWAGGLLGHILPFELSLPVVAPGVTNVVAIVINLLLMAVFAVQHTIMARSGFKKWITKFVPEHLERSTFMYFSSASLALIFLFWQPIGGEIWNVSNATLRGVIWAAYAAGWGGLVLSSFFIDHFSLFGLTQVWNARRGVEPKPASFKAPGPYKLVRHPMMTGVIVGLFALPTMSAGGLMLAITFTVYIYFGTTFEEKSLIEELGDDYVAYRGKVARLFPFVRLPGGSA